jgi:hypothetical protein
MVERTPRLISSYSLSIRVLGGDCAVTFVLQHAVVDSSPRLSNHHPKAATRRPRRQERASRPSISAVRSSLWSRAGDCSRTHFGHWAWRAFQPNRAVSRSPLRREMLQFKSVLKDRMRRANSPVSSVPRRQFAGTKKRAQARHRHKGGHHHARQSPERKSV